MQFTIHSIELSNIRAHRYMKFYPKQEGITSISGGTGAGKSTIVDSLAWAMFGTKPKGVKKASEIYRNTAVFPKDKCFAEVILKVDSEYIKIHRKMVNKSGGIECEIYKSKNNSLTDWDMIAGPAVSHAESFLRKYLLTDERSFLASVFLQQKKVDELVTASPKERNKVVEKLINVTPITNALNNARNESNALKKAIELSTSDESTLLDIEKELALTKEELEKGSVYKDRIELNVYSLTEKVSSLKRNLKELEVDFQRKKINESNLKSKEEMLELTDSRILESVERKKALSQKVKNFEAAGNRDVIEKELKAQKGLRDSLHKKVFLYENLESSIEDEKESLSLFILNNKTPKTKKGMLSRVENIEKLIENYLEKEGIYQKDISLKTGNISFIRKSIKDLNFGDKESKVCPTCEQTIEDTDSLLKHKNKDIKNLEKDINELKIKKESISSKIKGLCSEKEQILEALSIYEKIEDKESKRKRVEKEYKDIKTSKIPELTIKIEALEKVWHRLSQLEESKKEISDISSSLRLMLRKKSLYEDEIKKLKEEKRGIRDIKIEQVEKIRSTLSKEEDNLKEQENKMSRINYKFATLLEREKNLIERLDREKKSLEAYRELLKAQSEAIVSIETIADFREKTIEKNVPAIESMASDFFTSFTEGKFTGLRIDSKFNIEAQLVNGQTQSIGLLSGGELSAAALSLFFAVSILKNSGSTSSAIILDEPFTAQDASRTEIILSTIKKYINGQVIIIAHNASIESVVDETFNVEEEVKKINSALNA